MIRNAKRKLALLLAAVMLLGLLPTAAFAVDGTEPAGGTQVTESDGGTATTAPQPSESTETTTPPADAQPGDTAGDSGTGAAQPADDSGTAEPQPTEPEPVALTYEDLIQSTAVEGQPFGKGTLGSDNFRIPALVTLDNGNLVAAADARWEHTDDGRNLDTMTSVSTNGGATWFSALTNHFVDAEDGTSSNTSTSFIDPALATDGETVYMLVDLFPGGVYNISACQAGSGFDDQGRLLLKASGSNSYDYYVGDFNDSYAPILGVDGSTTNYAVDAYYNLYTVNNGTYIAVNYKDDSSYGEGAYIPHNVFFSGAPFTVFPTNYLWLVKSTDGGYNWSAPTLIDVKNDDERFYGVGPGRGLVTSDRTIYFSCYVYNGSENSQKSSLIYSTDGGETWSRTDDLDEAGGGLGAHWSSENQAVELNDGTIRMFYRNDRGLLCYVDLSGNSWSSPVGLNPDGDHICSNCQLSVIHYSKMLNGKEALLVSCPAHYVSFGTGRDNGKIFVYTLSDNNEMELAYTYEVTKSGEFYAYSCLTELSDGSIGLLYEDGDASITYKSFDMATIAPGAVIGSGETEAPQITDVSGKVLDGAPVALTVNSQPHTITVALDSGKYLEAVSNDTHVVTVGVNGNVVTLTPAGAGSTTVTLTVSSLSRATGDTATATLNVTVSPASVDDMGTIDLKVGETTDSLISHVDLSDASISYDPEGIASVEVTTKPGTTPGGSYTVLGNSTTSIVSGNEYVITSGNSVLATSSTSLTSASKPAADTALDSSVLWTIAGNSSGYTISQEINGTPYYLGYKRSGSSSWGITYYSYELALTTTPVTWQWNDGNFSNYLMTEDRPVISDKYKSFYLTYSSGWQMTDSFSSVALYTTEKREIPGEAYTNSTLTFTGVAPGTTTVTIGNYQYTVNVTEKPPFDESNYPIISNTGSTDYSKGREVEYLILARGSEYDLNVENASRVTWESASSMIASVNQNGTITANTIGETTITAHITDGTSQGDKTVHVTVVDPGSSYYGRTIEFYIADIQNSNLYYVENGHTGTFEFNQVQEHTVIYGTVYGKWNMVFFAAPHDGYALTYLSAANNYGNTDWTSIKDNQLVDPNNTAFRDAYGLTYYNSVLAQAQGTYGADGCFWFTRQGNSDGTGNCQAYIISISEKLPTVEKKIVSVDGEPYEPGMSAQKGDRVNFEITVTCYPSTYGITYSNARLTDTLTAAGAGDWVSQIPDLNRTGTQTFNYTYTVVDGDIGNTIRNTVSLSYNYSAQYSEGSYNVSDTASAQLTALPFTPKNYVVDFGLPVQFDMSLSDEGEQIAYNFTSAVSAQGMDIQILKNSAGYSRIIQYTPNKAFTGSDTVTVTNENGSEFTFHVYPATTVYYDGSFVEDSSGEPIAATSTFHQTASMVGSKANYGYQNNYSNAAFGTLPSTGTVEFSFTGTGVDVYANTTGNSCYVAVSLYDSSDNLEGLYLVDTAMVKGTSDYTSVPADISYNVPIVSLTGLDHGTYTVKIQRINPAKGTSSSSRTDVVLSGFRVYGTMADGSSIYSQDNEANPTFIEVRNSVLDTLNTTLDALLQNQFQQVYEAVNSDTVSASISGLVNNLKDAEDFLFNGPKNEVYLTKDQTLTITVPTAGTYQLGLKSLDAPTGTVSVNGVSKNVTNVDMFYTVDASDGTITIVNNSDSDTFISVSMLKSLGK